MSISVNSVSFCGKPSTKQAAKIVDAASKQATEIVNSQRPLIEQQEIALRNSINKIFESKLVKKIADSPMFKIYEKIFKG